MIREIIGLIKVQAAILLGFLHFPFSLACTLHIKSLNSNQPTAPTNRSSSSLMMMMRVQASKQRQSC